MKWKVKQQPEINSKREKIIFPLIPKRIGDYIYFFDIIKVEQIYTGGGHFDKWITTKILKLW